METGRGKWVTRIAARLGWLGLAAALVASMSAAAGTDSASFGVGLRLTASCQIDSRGVMDATSPTAISAPAVACGFAAPPTVRVTREALGLPASGQAAAESLDAVVVTLSF